MRDYSALDSNGKTLLHLAAEYTTGGLKTLLKKRAIDVNVRDSEGNTPIFYAAISHDTQRIELLIAAGATVHLINNSGCNCLHYACSRHAALSQRSFEKLLRLLAQYNLHPYAKNFQGLTPAHLACANSNLFAIQHFVTKQFFSLEFPDGSV